VLQPSLNGHADVLGDLAQQRWRKVAPLVKRNRGEASGLIVELLV
jgi:hypothetical protein